MLDYSRRLRFRPSRAAIPAGRCRHRAYQLHHYRCQHFLRSAPGTKLEDLVQHPHVAFQVERFNDGRWSSVVLKGKAVRLAADPALNVWGSWTLSRRGPDGHPTSSEPFRTRARAARSSLGSGWQRPQHARTGASSCHRSTRVHSLTVCDVKNFVMSIGWVGGNSISAGSMTTSTGFADSGTLMMMSLSGKTATQAEVGVVGNLINEIIVRWRAHDV